jgi:hypothetical protein
MEDVGLFSPIAGCVATPVQFPMTAWKFTNSNSIPAETSGIGPEFDIYWPSRDSRGSVASSLSLQVPL